MDHRRDELMEDDGVERILQTKQTVNRQPG